MAASEHPKLAFPSSFMWGTATASFQIEGCTQLGGRGPSIWDRFCSEKGRVANGDNGDPACDHYRRWRSDIDLIAGLGLPYYRFSIAWPRIYPRGVKGGLNEEGVEFYRNLIQGLKKKGVEPVATLYHWDLPTAIEDETGGWAGEGGVVEEFEAYARTCFEQFGDVVKWWITINEPWCCALLGYEVGEHAPGKIDKPGVNLYRAGHNLLLAHARGAKVYHDEFQDKQQGKIGITLNADWAEGVEERGQDAAARDMAFCLGWFADPIYLGDYPAVMREACGERLPKFTKAEKAMLKGSSDFLGLNHYSTHMVTGLKNENEFKDQGPSYYKDQRVASCELPEWKHSDMGWPIVPWGFRKLLVYMQERYNPSGGIIITENVRFTSSSRKAFEWGKSLAVHLQKLNFN